MIQIEVCDMRAAGKPGYVAKLDEYQERCFLQAKAYSSHGTSAKQVTYEISEDGVYEVCDANFGERKRKISFVVVRDGQDVFWSDSLREATSHADHLDGKIEDWAVCREEPIISNRTIDKPYPGIKSQPEQIKESPDVEVKALDLDGQRWLRVYLKSDIAFRLFLNRVKAIPGREYKNKGWSIPPDSVLLFRAEIERTERGELTKSPFRFSISEKAKEAMLMESVNA